MAVVVRPDKMPTYRFIGGSRGVPRGRRRKLRVPGVLFGLFLRPSGPRTDEKNNMLFIGELAAAAATVEKDTGAPDC